MQESTMNENTFLPGATPNTVRATDGKVDVGYASAYLHISSIVPRSHSHSDRAEQSKDMLKHNLQMFILAARLAARARSPATCSARRSAGPARRRREALALAA